MAGAVTLLAVAHSLTAVEQGYYYTFNSILGLQVFFELGLGYVLTIIVSHEVSNLTWTAQGTLVGLDIAKHRLSRFLHALSKWYLAAAILTNLIVMPVGLVFLAGKTIAPAAWRGPWMALVLVTSFNLFATAGLSFLEGTGLVAEVARWRFFMAVVSFGGHSGSLSDPGGVGLLSAALSVTATVLLSAFYLITSRGRLFVDLMRAPGSATGFSWRTEVWPFQWRVSASWISGYLVFQLFNPILFKYQGPVEAGRMGMSLSVITGTMAIGAAWMNTKGPQLGQLAAKGEFSSDGRSILPDLQAFDERGPVHPLFPWWPSTRCYV